MLADIHDNLVTAPRVPNTRRRVIWSDNEVTRYQSLVSSRLPHLRNNYCSSNSPASFSLLLKATIDVLNYSAIETNKTVLLSTPPRTKLLSIPATIRSSYIELKKAHTNMKSAVDIDKDKAFTELTKAKKAYRLATRKQRHVDNLKRDSQLFSLCTSNPVKFFKMLRSSKVSGTAAVSFLTVADGMYDSISALKTLDRFLPNPSPLLESWTEDYKNILQLCENKRDVPPISLQQSSKILMRMKPGVADFYSITPLHFLNAGPEGRLHFFILMNQAIYDINNTTAKELNTVYAQLLHKGHGKSRTSDRNYRTISTCPVLAKGLDLYIHDLFINSWNTVQAPTQYQGEGSSHELASLLLTEAIQESLHHLHLPLFLLFLDAKSAFDTVVIEFLVRNLYLSGMEGNSLIYTNNRLTNRLTFCDWNKEVMGPIHDKQGLEQGGCNSSDHYKVYNNDLLKIIQQSAQGVDIGDGLTVTAVGQADDVAIVSNNIHSLKNALNLALNYCQRFHVELCPDKTKLLVLSRDPEETFVPYN